MKKVTKKAGPGNKAIFTKMCKEIETECHKIMDKAASGNQDAMFCAMNGPMEVLHQAIVRVEDKFNKQLRTIRAVK